MASGRQAPPAAGHDRWPGEKLYLVLDSFSPHKRTEIHTWAADNDVELVFLPIYGSWLNWIESEFAALRYFALNDTDHRTHAEQSATIAAYLRRCNARAEPKTDFAPTHPSALGLGTQPRMHEGSAGALPLRRRQHHRCGHRSGLRRHPETGVTSVFTKSTAPSRW
ncbi:transposase [Streptomyces noursei]|uniref:transposase n=1 Tax=Streptomyces noursei TaxID=1971 RepID=UPI001CA50C24|nr:transposase [Streptomyces noursei]